MELHFDLCSQLSQSPSYFASGQRHSGEVSKYLELYFDNVVNYHKVLEARYFASGQRHSGGVSKYLELHFDLRSPLSQGPGS